MPHSRQGVERKTPQRRKSSLQHERIIAGTPIYGSYFHSQKYITYLVTENSITSNPRRKTERHEIRINVFPCHSVTGAVCSSFSRIITYFPYWSLCCGCIAVKKHLQLSTRVSSVTNARSNSLSLACIFSPSSLFEKYSFKSSLNSFACSYQILESFVYQMILLLI